jgi:hypothetical protein
MAAIDDATGAILAARFFPFEGTEGYLWLLWQIVTQYGIPISIYQDRHGSLKRNDDHWTLEEELAGRQEPTQVGQALKALGIQPIFALSPQAKGRIERLFGTLQDRLGAELALAKVTTLLPANAFLPVFLKRLNRRFAASPRQPEKSWRPVPPGPRSRSYAKARVEVRQLLNGSWKVYYQDRLIAKHSPTALREPIRALPRNKWKAKGTKSDNWIYQASAQPIYD